MCYYFCDPKSYRVDQAFCLLTYWCQLTCLYGYLKAEKSALFFERVKEIKKNESLGFSDSYHIKEYELISGDACIHFFPAQDLSKFGIS